MIAIGRRAKPLEPSDDPFALLEACHGKIRHFTDVAMQLGVSQATAPELAHTAGLVRRYFVEALPLHEADEEHSLFPRMAEHKALLDELTRDHREADLLVARLCALLQRLIDRDRPVQPELGYVAGLLGAAWKHHLALEERELFPRARAELVPAAGTALLDEMRARRGFSHGN